MKSRLFTALVITPMILLLCGIPGVALGDEQPNVAVLYSDDASYADFGFQPNCAEEMKNLTPNIDAIAEGGATFSNAYMSGAVCSPSRAGLMTGRYQQRFGYGNNLPPGTRNGRDLQEVFGAKRLQGLGYKTGAKTAAWEAQLIEPLWGNDGKKRTSKRIDESGRLIDRERKEKVGKSKAVSVPAAKKESPNIILCMTDDQGWGDVGYNGHPHLKTPNLDQMAGEGVKFTRFYSGAAMCSPTRASCYTGRNPYRYGITFAMKGMLEPSELPITSVLKQHGYTTGHFGKWHLGTLSRKQGDQKRWGAFAKQPLRYYCPPWERDVDVSFVTESKVPTWDPLIDPGPIKPKKSKEEVSNRGNPYGNEYFSGAGQTVTENTEGDDSRVIMDRAIPFIQNAVEEEKPFFAAVWFHTPHSPVVGGPKYREMYKDQPENAQHYYACLTAMDEQVGRLRAELEKLGVADNTMLWFCSDNGPARQGSPRHVGSAGDLKGYKLSINEGGIRVPGLMVWPDKVKSPRTIDAPCFTSDYFPTILDALGIDLPSDRDYDGTTLLPFLVGNQVERKKPLGFLNKDGKESVWMEQRYKYISTKKGEQLYDIIADPGESKNLSEQQPEVAQRMKTELAEWKAAVMADWKKCRKGNADRSKK